MFLHLGENTVITTNEIIGIFDMDNTTVSKITRDYLSSMQKNKRIVDVSFDLPKSFILCKNKASSQFWTTFDSLFKVSEIYLSNNDAAIFKLLYIVITIA